MVKLSTQIADEIGLMIADAGWPIGEVVGTEPQLARRFGVSPAILGEAIGLIELRGLATMKTGRGGGLLVNATAYDGTVTELATYLGMADVRTRELMEIWHLLQAKAVELAIEHMDDAAALALSRFSEWVASPLQDGETEAGMIREFWGLLARLSGNPVLEMLVAAFQTSMSGLSMTRLYEPDQLHEHLTRSRATKSAILQGVVSCDLFTALSALRSDFLNQYDVIKRSRIDTMSRIPADGERHKLPRLIAFKISRRIAEQSLRPGDRLGSEAELLAQFAVSRSVLREAVRMLEAYCVVEARRGQGGGLHVAKPDPTSTFTSVVRFLKTLPAHKGHMFELRAALEIRGAGLAAKRIEGERLQLLENCLLEAKIANRDPATRMAGIMRIPGAIAEGSNNSVLAFVCGVTHAHILDSFGVVSQADVAVALESYGRIIAAIGEGDAGRARRLMHQHLRVISTMNTL